MSDTRLVLVVRAECVASSRASHALRQFGGAIRGVPIETVDENNPTSAAAAFAARTHIVKPLLVALRGDRAVGTFSGPFEAVPMLRFALAAFAAEPATRLRSSTV